MPSSLWQDGEPLPRSRARESAVCMCFGRSKVPGLQQWHRARACPRFFFPCVEPQDSGSHSGETARGDWRGCLLYVRYSCVQLWCAWPWVRVSCALASIYRVQYKLALHRH